MEEKFKKYLNSIGITEALTERTEIFYEFFRKRCPEKITGIFVSDYINENGEREYQDLWFFSFKYYMFASDFAVREHLFFGLIKDRVYLWELEKENYDFKRATERSRMHLIYSIPHAGFDLKASKENCDYLRDIFLRYVIPNLEE